MKDHLKITLLSALAGILLFNDGYGQSATEVGTDLTNRYAQVLNLSVPNSMLIDGREMWMMPLPRNFDLDDYKSGIEEVSNDLGVSIISDWRNQDGMDIYGLDYEGFRYALIYMPENNLIAAAIELIDSQPSASSTPSGQWETVYRFTGSGMKNTAPFTVNSNEWKVVYRSVASSSLMGGAGHILQIYLLRPGQEMFEGDIVANEVNKTTISGESYVYKSGRFYFNSNSANGNWEIEVQVQQ
ncbi:hypothetical protein IQ255_29695 [Pleurocapsales cyanobacterium LEGE 10410]|nr:hypothetical protein [Pleurocapsales cyanobacterium LEGE 10410]